MKSLFIAMAILLSSGFMVTDGFAKGKGSMAMTEPSKEDRAKMATMHEEMASCLKSDKKFSECHEHMMKTCPMMKDGKKCPMMMHHGHDMKKGAPSEGGDHSEHSGH